MLTTKKLSKLTFTNTNLCDIMLMQGGHMNKPLYTESKRLKVINKKVDKLNKLPEGKKLGYEAYIINNGKKYQIITDEQIALLLKKECWVKLPKKTQGSMYINFQKTLNKIKDLRFVKYGIVYHEDLEKQIKEFKKKHNLKRKSEVLMKIEIKEDLYIFDGVKLLELMELLNEQRVRVNVSRYGPENKGCIIKLDTYQGNVGLLAGMMVYEDLSREDSIPLAKRVKKTLKN